ncbi:MAG: hypothetical protein K2L96_07275 [Muribaculaceae bacterium]|nr:hypothetical protein [Muribaculaceae bacterium]
MSEIQYKLRGVTVEQFATVYEPADGKIESKLTIPIKTNYDERTLAVGANIQFSCDDKPFLIAESFCHYEISEECWNELSAGATKDVELPTKFMDMLARIAIGTLRGVLAAKTENTPYSKYILPILQIQSPKDRGDFILAKNN